MDNRAEKVTKIHLKAFGLSDYAVKQLVAGLDSVSVNCGLKEYRVSDVQEVVEKRLANPRVQATNREKLQRVLTWLRGESNVVPVDFLRNLTPEKRIEVLRARVQELEVQEKNLMEETERLLVQAHQMVGAK